MTPQSLERTRVFTCENGAAECYGTEYEVLYAVNNGKIGAPITPEECPNCDVRGMGREWEDLD